MTMADEGDEDAVARRLLGEIDFVFDLDMMTNLNYSELATPALLEEFEKTKDKLIELEELLDPKTPEGIDLHAVYHGLLLELKTRGAL